MRMVAARPDCPGCSRTASRSQRRTGTTLLSRALGVRIGQAGRSTRPLLLLVNAGDRSLDFQLPPGRWQVLLDSSTPRGRPAASGTAASVMPLAARSLMLLQLRED